MRKLIIAPVKNSTAVPTESWLDLEDLAVVEVTSEESSHPIESVFVPDAAGWRAATPGTQTIRLVFDKPQRISRIWLLFEDAEHTRTQEFVLRWSSDQRETFREIVRQQWNFSQPDSTREIENYKVDLPNVSVLELIVVPDNRGGEARASVQKFLLA